MCFYRFDLGSHSITHMVTGVTSRYSTREMLEEVGVNHMVALQLLFYIIFTGRQKMVNHFWRMVS